MELIQESAWGQGKEQLLEGLVASKRTVASTLMENTRKLILETSGASSTVAADIGNFQKIVIPMIRRIVPATIAMDLVGVQPMTGPVGLIYTKKVIFGEAANPSGTVNDITAGDEMFANNSKMKRFYSTGGATASYPPALSDTASTGVQTLTENYEGFGGRKIKNTYLKQTVTAGTRKLQASWTTESAHDLSTQHGLVMETEMTADLAALIAQEIDNQVLTELTALAGTVATYDFATPPAGYSPTFIGDRFAELGILINKVTQEIGAKTRRDAGNWLVGSHFITSLIQSGSKSVFAPTLQANLDSAAGNKMVGMLNGRIKVYSYNWGLGDAWSIGGGADTATGATGEDILIGYKGGESQMDAGYFYCPYVPVYSTGVIMDPNTFSPVISLGTRYGIATFTETSTSLGNSADYYARIRVMNVAFS